MRVHTHIEAKLQSTPMSEFRCCLFKVLMDKHSHRHTPECTYCISMPCVISNKLHLNDTMGYVVIVLGFILYERLIYYSLSCDLNDLRWKGYRWRKSLWTWVIGDVFMYSYVIYQLDLCLICIFLRDQVVNLCLNLFIVFTFYYRFTIIIITIYLYNIKNTYGGTHHAFSKC